MSFSDLLRHLSETTEWLNRTRAVRLHRRDAADLVLMSTERADAEAELVEVASRVLVPRPVQAYRRVAAAVGDLQAADASASRSVIGASDGADAVAKSTSRDGLLVRR